MNTNSIIDLCWNRIGVFGDKTCPELADVIHCRNCSVFAAAGRALLDRTPSDEYVREWTQKIEQENENSSSESFSLLLFRLGVDHYALLTTCFEEIAEVRSIHSLPHNKSHTLLGLVNVQGDVLLCVSLLSLFDIESPSVPSTPQSRCVYPRLVVISHNSERWVFPVDEVFDIHKIHPSKIQTTIKDEIKPDPPLSKGIFQWNQNRVVLLDEHQLCESLRRSLP